MKKIKTILALTLIAAIIAVSIFALNVSADTPKKKYIAFTFDDGPNNTTCSEILDILNENGAHATFFCIGTNCTAATKGIMNRILASGSELGMHGYNHSNMSGFFVDEAKEDMQKCSDAIYAQTGFRPCLFRLPHLSMPMTKPALAIGYPLIAGSGPADWDNGTTTEQRINGWLNEARDGQIMLCHCIEGNTRTRDALKTVLPELKKQGYEFVTVSELFKIKGFENPDLGCQWYYVGEYKDTVMPDNYYECYEAEKTKRTGVYSFITTYQQATMAPMKANMVQTNHSSAGDYIEYTLTGLKTGEYSLILDSHDTSRGCTADISVKGASLGKINFYHRLEEYVRHDKNEDGNAMKFNVTATDDGTVNVRITMEKSCEFYLDRLIVVASDGSTLHPTEPTTAAITTTIPTTVAPTTEPTTMYVTLGDVNHDNNINAKDVLLLRKYLAKQKVTIDAAASDVDKSGSINAKDVLLIRKYNAKIIKSF